MFEEQVQTNISNNTLISLVTRFYDEREITQVFACTGPYLSTGINADGEPVIDRQLMAWRELMTVVDSGEDPATIMPQYNFQGDKSDYVKEKAPAESSTSSGKATSSKSTKGSASSKARSKDVSQSASSSKGA